MQNFHDDLFVFQKYLLSVSFYLTLLIIETSKSTVKCSEIHPQWKSFLEEMRVEDLETCNRLIRPRGFSFTVSLQSTWKSSKEETSFLKVSASHISP